MLYENLALVLAYAIIGFGLKYIDEVFDKKVYSKKMALLFVILCSILIGVLCAIDNYSMAIFFAIIIGVAISGKIDNIAFKTGAILALCTVFLIKYLFLHSNTIDFLYFVFFILLTMCILDEELDEVGHKKDIRLFKTRPFMKIAIVLLWMAQSVIFIYVLAFFAFDIAYTFAEYKPPRKPHFDIKKENG